MTSGWLKNAVFSIFFAIILTWFALSNSQIVKITLLIWTKDISLSLIILISILVGVIITGFIALMEEMKMQSRIKELESKLKELEKPAQ